jgi:hypothetical protein
MIEPLLRNGSNTRLFIKPEDNLPRHEAEAGAPDINKWGIYSAVRYCLIINSCGHVFSLILMLYAVHML